jgi:hypothetical protein
MANEDFDVLWRVVSFENDDELQASVADVECFESYGEALAHWMMLDRRAEGYHWPLEPGELVDWELVDPNGKVLLDHTSKLYPSSLAGAMVGRYRWDEKTEMFVYLM